MEYLWLIISFVCFENNVMATINVHWRCLSNSARRQIYLAAKLPIEHVSARNTHHNMCHPRVIVPMPSFLGIVPIESCLQHRAPAIVLVPVAVPLCQCQCACARAIVTVPSCPRHGARAIVLPPSRAIVSVPVPSRLCHCSITSDTHAVNGASVT